MSNTSNDSLHLPLSSLASGRFLSLLAIQLVMVGLGLYISRDLYRTCGEIVDRRQHLAQSRLQVDGLSGRLNRLYEAVQASSADGKRTLAVPSDLEAAVQTAASVQGVSADLPNETAAVQQSVAGLKLAVQAWEESRRGSGLTEISAATVEAERSLDSLRSGIERLDEESLSGLADIRRISSWNNACELLTCLLIFLAFGFAVRLYRQLQREEQARFGIESELAAERTALEKRVQARTAALEAEVRERQRAERLNRGRNQSLEMLARNESPARILQILANTVAEHRSTWACAIHTLDAGHLKMMASAGLNEKVTQRLLSISTDFTGAPESVAVASGKPHLILDLGLERKTWSELLRANGLHSVWSAPFLSPDAKALGTLTVYTLLKWNPTPGDIEMLETARHMASLVLERSRMQSQLVDHAYHDSLTGLPNRRLGRDRLANAANRAERIACAMAVLWIDLNKFKQINDQYGHPVGDAVLQQTAQRLSGRLRGSDTLARMGGDEFMAILEGIKSREEAEATAADLSEILARPMQVGELELNISASFGIALYPEDGKSVDSLAQHADQAMYAAKFGGFGVLSFTPEMDRLQAERRELQSELSQALDSGGFTLAYQPLCLPDGSLHGFEALLRFKSPRLGNVPPSEFIPIAEEMELIVPLGEWVLREVCRQSRAWDEAGLRAASIAVNISAIQFAREDFADTVANILVETGHSGSRLVLELTESIVMHDFSESARQMKRLKRLGARIAIDDFGTGYSSLSYLHRLPIDVLKIDRSFMEHINDPEGTRPIVDAVLSMAHTLGLCVVAEGVETAAQLATLRGSGCDIIQGYFFSKPVTPDSAARFIRSGTVAGTEKLASRAPVSTPASARVSAAVN